MDKITTSPDEEVRLLSKTVSESSTVQEFESNNAPIQLQPAPLQVVRLQGNNNSVSVSLPPRPSSAMASILQSQPTTLSDRALHHAVTIDKRLKSASSTALNAVIANNEVPAPVIQKSPLSTYSSKPKRADRRRSLDNHVLSGARLEDLNHHRKHENDEEDPLYEQKIAKRRHLSDVTRAVLPDEEKDKSEWDDDSNALLMNGRDGFLVPRDGVADVTHPVHVNYHVMERHLRRNLSLTSNDTSVQLFRSLSKPITMNNFTDSKRQESSSSKINILPAGDQVVIDMPELPPSPPPSEATFDRRITFYSETHGLYQAPTLEQLADGQLASLMRDGCFWLDVLAPSDDDLKLVTRVFNIHPLTAEDIQLEDTREKCELFENYIYLCLAVVDADSRSPTYLETSTIHILVLNDCILSIHAVPQQHIDTTLTRLQHIKSYLRLTSDWVMYSLLDDVVDAYQPLQRTMELEVDSIDDLVLILSDNEQTDMLRRIGSARKTVTQLMRLLQPKREIVSVLTKRCGDRLESHTALYLYDIQDHILAMLTHLEHDSETLNRSHANYLAQISIDITQASNRMNRVMKKLTAGASLVLPLTLIASVFGVNVPVPFQKDTDWTEMGPFTAMVLAMVLIALAMYKVGKRQDWF